MKTIENDKNVAALVTGAQIAEGEKFHSPFWDEVAAELDKSAPPKIEVAPRKINEK